MPTTHYFKGTTLSIDDDTGTPVTIGQVESIELADGESSDINVTTAASTAMEYVPGLQDFGTSNFGIVLNADDLGYIEALDAKDQREIRTFIVTLPTGTLNVGTFEGYVKSIPLNAANNDVWRVTITVKVTGKIVWT